MNNLHASLRSKLAALRAAPVQFSSEHECFVVDGVKKCGITQLLSELVQVPRAARVEQSVEQVDVSVARFKDTVVGQCGHCDTAVRWMRSLTTSSIAARLARERSVDKAHGIVVDHQIELYVRKGREALFRTCRVVDPCVGTLLAQLDANGWSIVGTQVPIYHPGTDCATAIDVFVTDRDTRRQLILLEVKAIRGKRVVADRNDVSYVHARGVLKRSVLKGIDQSYYSRHQLQLLLMNDAVRTQFAFDFDRSMVMRVSPGIVRTYPLSPRFARRRTDIVEAISQRKKRKASAEAHKRKRVRAK